MLSRSKEVLTVVAVGVAVRLAVVGISHGTNDVGHWADFASHIRAHGLFETYRAVAFFNHPPVMGWLVAALHTVADWTGIAFSYWLRLPGVLADVAAVWLAASMVRSQPLRWLIALNPVSVSIAAYHGNVDAICIAACLFSASFLHRQHFGRGAMCLGLALNVKLMPAALLICWLGYCGGRRRLGRFLAFLAPFGLPFAIALVAEWDGFTQHVLGYNALRGVWGFAYFAMYAQHRYPVAAATFLAAFVASAKYLIIGLACAVAWLQAHRRPWSTFELGALAFSVTLIFVPGFGIQYMIYPALFVLLARPRLGVELALLCSAFVVGTYAYYWTGEFPLTSRFLTPAPGVAEQALGLLAWYLMARVAWKIFTEGVRSSTGDVTRTSDRESRSLI